MATEPVLLNLILIHAMEERRSNRVEENDVGIAFGKTISSSFYVHFLVIFSLAEFILLLEFFQNRRKEKKKKKKKKSLINI